MKVLITARWMNNEIHAFFGKPLCMDELEQEWKEIGSCGLDAVVRASKYPDALCFEAEIPDTTAGILDMVRKLGRFEVRDGGPLPELHFENSYD